MSLIRNGRLLVYPAEVLLDTDLLRAEIFRMVDVSMLAQSIIGGWPTPTPIVTGLAATPTVTPAFSVTIAPGVIYQYEQLDATAYGSVPADTTQSIFKQGINLATSQIDNLNAPVGVGDSIAYLIQAQLATTDTEPTTRQYYNPITPSVPITASANDVRTDTVSLSLKSSSPAPSPTTPTPDAGHIGLWVVTVPQGATVITTGMISVYSINSFLSEVLPQKVSYTSLQKSSPIYGDDISGAPNTITVNNTVPAYTQIVAGTHIYIKIANTNTGATGLNINSLGSHSVFKSTNSGMVALTGGELQSGGIFEFLYDGSNYQLLNPSASSSFPPGMFGDFGMASPPVGWLACDGSAVAQATYPALFAAISTTWNTGGEGAGNFRLPNMQRRNRVGSGGSATSPAFTGTTTGSYGGEEVHTGTVGEMAAHGHPGSSFQYISVSASAGGTPVLGNLDSGPDTYGISTIASNGSSTPFNEMPLGAIVTMCIKT